MKLTLKRILWIVVPLVLVTFIWIKWNTWFTIPPEPLYSTSSIPGRLMLTWSEDPMSTRDITWECDTSSHTGLLRLTCNSTPEDTVVYSSSSRIIKSPGGATAFFRVALKNLRQGETYHYKVANDSHWSESHSFKIGNRTDSSFSFVFLGDVQDSVNGITGKIFHRAVENQPDASFMMFAGDMIERPHDAYWRQWFDAGKSLFGSIPVIATPGNHEYYKGLFPKIDDRWMAHFSFPQNGPPNFLGKVCYWDYLNCRFISLDSNGINSISSALEQRRWLKSVLENSHQRWIVLMMHHPFYSTSPGRNNFHLRILFKSLLDQFHVDLVLQGHDHAYGRAAHIPNSVSRELQGPVYVVTHASPKLYDINFSEKLDVLASNTQMYQLVHVSNDSISFRAFTFEGAYFDGFTLTKDDSGKSVFHDYAPNVETGYLKPTNGKIRKSSEKQIIEYNRSMQEWIEGKKH
jgi:hypothetical protein